MRREQRKKNEKRALEEAQRALEEQGTELPIPKQVNNDIEDDTNPVPEPATRQAESERNIDTNINKASEESSPGGPLNKEAMEEDVAAAPAAVQKVGISLVACIRLGTNNRGF